jgi:hypothetical protein
MRADTPVAKPDERDQCAKLRTEAERESCSKGGPPQKKLKPRPEAQPSAERLNGANQRQAVTGDARTGTPRFVLRGPAKKFAGAPPGSTKMVASRSAKEA